MQRATHQVLALNVRTPQPARAAARVKGPAAVHDAQVVEQDALAGLHLDLVHGRLGVDEGVEELRGLEPGAQVRRGDGEAVLEGRAPVDAGEDALGRRAQEGALLLVPVAELLVVVRHVDVGEVGDGVAILLQPEQLAGAEAVAEERLAARARVLHAVQQLHRGRALQVEQVLVQPQVAARVRDVLGVGLGAHVKGAAVERRLDVGDALGDAGDGGLVVRHVLEEDEAEVRQVEQDLPERILALHKLMVVDPADPLLNRLRVPEGPPGLGVDGVLARIHHLLHVAVAEGLFDRVPREDHLMPAAPREPLNVIAERDAHAIVGEPDVLDLNDGGDVGARKVLLPG